MEVLPVSPVVGVEFANRHRCDQQATSSVYFANPLVVIVTVLLCDFLMVCWSPSVSASLLIVSNEAPLSVTIFRSSAEIAGRDAMPNCGVITFDRLKNVSHARS